ncbi:hypothetical protein [Halorubellus salinus]|uniref:hypothetical protein n=1 Tax=Halorubellus salinus TaxID=755309 RepID=UPI001D073F78|nr:hypothetical protein [Halorubellus salinus]
MRLGGLLDRVKRVAIGDPSRLKKRVVVAGFAVTLVVATAGVWLAAQSGLESATTTSTGYLRPVLELATNTWTYVLLLAFIFRGVLLYRDRRYAEQAADVTGYATRSVRRLAAEAKEPDGSTRVIATDEDDRESIRERVLAALDGADDDRMKLREELFAEPTAEDDLIEHGELGPALDVRDEHLDVVLGALEDRSRELDAALDDATADVPGSRGDVDQLLEEAEANLELQDEVLETLATSERRRQAELVAEEDAREVEDVETQEVTGIRSALRAFFGRGPAPATSEDVDDVEDESGRDEWLEEWKLLKLDVATAVNFDRLVWQFAVPGLVTIVGLLIVAQFWIKPFLYPPLFAVGVLVGLLYYLRQSRKRSKRLEALRREEEPVDWRDAAILVKEVEVPERTLQYAWLAGDVYVHDDREEFADEVAHRAVELLSGLDPSPSVLEKQAEQIRGMKPDLHAFRDQERKLVMERLMESVEASETGLVPKAKVIEDVVEYDIEARTLLPGKRGMGHDPALVREAYRDLVPAALVEQEIALEEDGDETVTAVRHRGDPIPPEFGTIRAQFSNQFGNYATWDPLYELPSVDDVLEEEPMLTGNFGHQRGEA